MRRCLGIITLLVSCGVEDIKTLLILMAITIILLLPDLRKEFVDETNEENGAA